MAASLLIILAAVLGFGLGWLAKSAGRRVIVLESPDVTEESKTETANKNAAARPEGQMGAAGCEAVGLSAKENYKRD
jgi:hypothetical protein